MWYRPDGHYDDQLTVDDVTLSVLPMSHQYGYVTVISSLLVGHRIVVMSQFKPDEYVRLADKYKVNACRDVNKTFFSQDQDKTKTETVALSFLPPSRRICNRRCLSVCFSVSNFAQKLPNGFA